MSNYVWQSWGTTPEKAYYNHAGATLNGGVTSLNGYDERSQSTNTGGVISANGTNNNATSPEIPSIEKFNPQTTYTAPSYTAPEDYNAPDYAAPTYDEGKVETLTQRKSAPGLRAARQALQQATGGYYDNPNVKRMTLRDALAGYGMSVENIMSGASDEARSQYNTEYGIAADASKTNYNANVEEGKLNYNTKLTKSQLDYAARTAEAEKAYNAKLDAEKTNYGVYTQTLMANYQAQLAAYMAQKYGTGATKYGTASSQNANEAPTATAPAAGVRTYARWSDSPASTSIYTPENPNG